MSLLRKIEINGTNDEYRSLIDGTSPEQVINAMSYLTTWAMDGYDVVSICFTPVHKEITAHYSCWADDTVVRRYLICGIWSDDTKKFSFHS